ncbi:MAG: BrnT family toxin [Bryobacteraceae bacterium]
MAVEWDPAKARANLRKHGVRFADAPRPLFRREQISHSRLPVPSPIGMDSLARILVVVYTWRGGQIRLISARPATRSESRQYEDGL